MPKVVGFGGQCLNRIIPLPSFQWDCRVFWLKKRIRARTAGGARYHYSNRVLVQHRIPCRVRRQFLPSWLLAWQISAFALKPPHWTLHRWPDLLSRVNLTDVSSTLNPVFSKNSWHLPPISGVFFRSYASASGSYYAFGQYRSAQFSLLCPPEHYDHIRCLLIVKKQCTFPWLSPMFFHFTVTYSIPLGTTCVKKFQQKFILLS